MSSLRFETPNKMADTLKVVHNSHSLGCMYANWMHALVKLTDLQCQILYIVECYFSIIQPRWKLIFNISHIDFSVSLIMLGVTNVFTYSFDKHGWCGPVFTENNNTLIDKMTLGKVWRKLCQRRLCARYLKPPLQRT